MKGDEPRLAYEMGSFWAVDLHIRTPASGDARDEDFGTASDIVQRALDAGLSAIAVTDHNTVAWCSQMAEAGEGNRADRPPGFELSTPQGHLLGIWEEGPPHQPLRTFSFVLG
jgi:predicted metal-dependent phosphoesterase TrpH